MAETHASPTNAIEPDGSSCSDQSIDTDFASIVSTIPNYVYQNGRRYHATYLDKYLFPNDEREQERLDFMHHLFRLTLDGDTCFTKLENPERILDIGTGTGIWAIEMAELYPGAEVIGTDLSPIQPGWAPDNVQFQVDDALQEWTFPVSSFDFIHIRTLDGSQGDWQFLLNECYRHLRPGGRLEVAEARTQLYCDDGSYPQDSRTKYWETEFNNLARKLGYDFDIAPRMRGLIQDAGFTDTETIEKAVPLGTWPKDKRLKTIGRYFLAQFLSTGLETYSVGMLSRAGGWNKEDLQNLLEDVRSEVLRQKMHIYSRFSFTIARKPLDA